MSRASLEIRFARFDVLWAFITPTLALWIRGTEIIDKLDWYVIGIFSSVSLAASLFSFLVFRTRDGLTHLFSVHDAIELAKAVLLTEFLTYIVVFTATRLEGIPRTTPLIHALILAAGLVCARALVRMSYSEKASIPVPTQPQAEYIIVIGSNRLASLYISFLQAYAPDKYEIAGVLDDREEMAGRSVAGVRVLGSSFHLASLITEFKDHGLRTDRVIIAGDSDYLSEEAFTEVTRICDDNGIRLDFVPQLIGLEAIRSGPIASACTAPTLLSETPRNVYHQIKRYIDFVLAATLIIVLMPVYVFTAILVLVDIGSPVFFWQRRTGLNGRTFQIHKFRTLKPSFDWRGRPIASTERVSWVGEGLRRLRLDELPQLLNVLVGDMALIGPRPLLPQDQPADPRVRLSVRPGITGWAQVNGGKSLNAEEKNSLDEWYVENAGFGLDMRILVKTIVCILSRENDHRAASSFVSTEFSRAQGRVANTEKGT